jgi:hypothetical protein
MAGQDAKVEYRKAKMIEVVVGGGPQTKSQVAVSD